MTPDPYAPCPCGSGKKFKFCCYQKTRESSKVADFEWVKLRQTEGYLTEKLLNFAGENYSKETMKKAWNEFSVGEGCDLGDSPEFEPLFTPWFLFNWKASANSLTVGEHYLADKETSLHEKNFIEGIVQRPYSFYLVENAIPEISLTLKGLLLPETFTVKERQASQTVEKGYIVFCRVLPTENVNIMVGCSPYIIPPNYHYNVLDLRDNLKKRCGTIDLDILHKYSAEIRRVYFSFVETIKDPLPPRLQNTDGDPLISAEVRYELHCSPQDALDSLCPLSLIQAADEILEDAVYDDKKELRKVSFDWTKMGNKVHAGWDNTVLGNITIDGKTLTAFVNSEKRAKQIKKEIENRLGERALYKTTIYDTFEQHLKNVGQENPESLFDQDNELMNHPEVQAKMKEMMEAHWKKWFDEPIPALKGKTPRQAAKSKEGRERLEALLNEYEVRDQMSSKDNFMKADIASLRKELGLK